MTLKKIIRKLKLKFYELNKNISKVLGEYNLVGSSIVLLTIILNFGFNNFIIKEQNLIVLIVSIFYLTSYILRGAIQVNFWQFIKKNKILSLIIFIISIDLTNILLADFFFKQLSNSRIIVILLIQLYFFFNSLSSILKNDSSLNKKPISPPALLIISFSSLIIIGTLLLMMPDISSTGKSIGFKKHRNRLDYFGHSNRLFFKRTIHYIITYTTRRRKHHSFCNILRSFF